MTRAVRARLVVAMALSCAFGARASGAPTLTTLAAFDGSNGSVPTGGLTLDLAGNLYGTTAFGGSASGLGQGRRVRTVRSRPQDDDDPGDVQRRQRDRSRGRVDLRHFREPVWDDRGRRVGRHRDGLQAVGNRSPDADHADIVRRRQWCQSVLGDDAVCGGGAALPRAALLRRQSVRNHRCGGHQRGRHRVRALGSGSHEADHSGVVFGDERIQSRLCPGRRRGRQSLRNDDRRRSG